MSYLSRIAQSYSYQVLTDAERERYGRHILLPGVGLLGQQKLKCARVLVVGAGGLGCPVLQALAGAGVGYLTVLDGDSVAVSNLARQWLHLDSDAGSNKAESAARKLRYLNPFITVESVPSMLDADNADWLVASHDLVVDATDSVGARQVLDAVCGRYDKPWVHGALYRSSGQVVVFWERFGARFSSLFPEDSEVAACSGTGVLGAFASIVGNLQALEVIKLVTGCGCPRVGELVVVQADCASFELFRLGGVKAPELIASGSEAGGTGDGWPVDQLMQDLSAHLPLRLVDLRERDAFERGSLPGAEWIAADRLLGHPESLDGGVRVLLFCEEGSISQLMAAALGGRVGVPIQHLRGGMQAWSRFNPDRGK